MGDDLHEADLRALSSVLDLHIINIFQNLRDDARRGMDRGIDTLETETDTDTETDIREGVSDALPVDNSTAQEACLRHGGKNRRPRRQGPRCEIGENRPPQKKRPGMHQVRPGYHPSGGPHLRRPAHAAGAARGYSSGNLPISADGWAMKCEDADFLHPARRMVQACVTALSDAREAPNKPALEAPGP